jgi:hypothetical protein
MGSSTTPTEGGLAFSPPSQSLLSIPPISPLPQGGFPEVTYEVDEINLYRHISNVKMMKTIQNYNEALQI